MVEAANASPRVLETPKPAVWMTAFGENAIEHEIRVWIRDPEAGLGSVRSEILNRVLELFRENGIEIPCPQRDVRIKEWPERRQPAEAPSSSLSARSSAVGEARGGGARRRGLAGGEQRLDPGGGPDRGLGGERLEAALRRPARRGHRRR